MRLRPALRRTFYRAGGSRIAARVLRRWRDPLAILCFHQVTPEESPSSEASPRSSQAIPLVLFETLMSRLAQDHRLVSMDEAADRVRAGSVESAVAVTFDDGYKDNLTYALPILKKYNIPATIYVTTRFLEGDCRMWWSDLREAIATRKAIRLEVQGSRMEWKIRRPPDREACLRQVRTILLRQDRAGLENLMTQIRGGEASRQYSSDCLTWDDIALLHREPLITIGAHGHSHHNLKTLSEREIWNEMETCQKLLEGRLGEPARHFAYPGGDPEWIGEREVRLAREFGWKTAVTLISRPARPSLHELPRLLVPNDMTIPMLRAYLAGWKPFWRRSASSSEAPS
jgi:peptidoglycan/xylan/chitin deacetylase (PgdA/CDA1 family)